MDRVGEMHNSWMLRKKAVYTVTTTLELLKIQPNISFPRLSELII